MVTGKPRAELLRFTYPFHAAFLIIQSFFCIIIMFRGDIHITQEQFLS